MFHQNRPSKKRPIFRDFVSYRLSARGEMGEMENETAWREARMGLPIVPILIVFPGEIGTFWLLYTSTACMSMR